MDKSLLNGASVSSYVSAYNKICVSTSYKAVAGCHLSR